MSFYPQERIALFIDGSNLYAAAKGLDFDIDYKRLLKYFSDQGQMIRYRMLLVWSTLVGGGNGISPGGMAN